MTQGRAAKQAAAAKPKTHVIRMSVAGGKIVYTGKNGKDASTIRAQRGDTIQWKSADGNYAVLFDKETPFKEVAYHGLRGRASEQAKVNGAKGEYSYTAIVTPEKRQRIIDPPPAHANPGRIPATAAVAAAPLTTAAINQETVTPIIIVGDGT